MPLILTNQIDGNILELISGSYSTDISFREADGDFIRMTITDPGGQFTGDQYFFSNRYTDNTFVTWELNPGDGPPTASLSANIDDSGNHYPVQLPVYYNEGNYNDIFTKPNDILDEENVNPGNYRLKFDFFTDYFRQIETNNGIIGDAFDDYDDVRFIVSEVSPSRTEIRVIPRGIDVNTGETEVAHVFTEASKFNFYDTLGTNNSEDDYPIYEYNYFVSFEEQEKEVLINNYQFDDRTSPAVTGSLVLKLNKPIPAGVTPLITKIRIYKKIISSQFQDIMWFEEEEIPEIWEGLEPDTSVETYWSSDPIDDFENHDAVLSGSDSYDLEYIHSNAISGSNKYLKVNYNSFSNHTHFGSAAQKLENFKTKFAEIQTHYTKISESLSVPTVASESALSIVRNESFKNIYDLCGGFTPYERFLYFDVQSQSTSSAPGLGRDYSFISPVTTLYGTYETLINQEGFPKVYKHYNDSTGDNVEIFSGKYYADSSPFYNSTGSFYLSFLVRSGSGFSGDTTGSWKLENPGGMNGTSDPSLPQDAWSGKWIQSGSLSGSWNRWVVEASQSHWRPTTNVGFDASAITNWNNGSTHWEILSGSNITGSDPIIADGYPTFNQSSDGHFETSSIVPSGELFRVQWIPTVASAQASSSFITDVRISKNNPTASLPFMDLYPTGSDEFTNWYTQISSSAVEFDEANIHSLFNTLPEFYQNQTSDFSKFVHMMGEYYDLLKNYIDNYSKNNRRTYVEDDFASDKLLPYIADNLGWDLIDPAITGSIAETLVTSVSGSISQTELVSGMWRKVINNLIYIYKTKGTEASVRALLNSYGYPGIDIKQYGGTTDGDDMETYQTNRDTMNNPGRRSNIVAGSNMLKTLVFNENNSGLILDHYTRGAENETIQFMFSSFPTGSTQDLVVSSGSGDEVLWKITLIPSHSNAPDGPSALSFQLGSQRTGSGTALSMETPDMYFTSRREQKLWNVQLSAASSSVTGSNGVQQYTLRVAHRDGQNWASSSAVSMSVNGGLSAFNSNANANWRSTGSLSSTYTKGNLWFGVTPGFRGEIGQIKTWKKHLGGQQFYRYVNDPFINAGNSISSSLNDINYIFEFNDKIKSGSNYTITDSSFNSASYTRALNKTTFKNPTIRVRKYTTYTDNPTDAGIQENSNKIFFIPRSEQNLENFSGRLSPERNHITNPFRNDDRYKSNKLDIGVSNVDAINKWIYRQMAGYEISELIANPKYWWEDSWEELDTFRDDLFNSSGVQININKWIRAQENRVPKDLKEAISSVTPLRTQLDRDIIIQNHFLDRNRIKLPIASIATGSEAGFYGPEFNTVNIIKPSPSVSSDVNFEKTGKSIELYDIINSEIFDTVDGDMSLLTSIDSEVMTPVENTLKDLINIDLDVIDTKDSSISDLVSIDSLVNDMILEDYNMLDNYKFNASVENILTDIIDGNGILKGSVLPIIEDIIEIDNRYKIISEVLDTKTSIVDSLPNTSSEIYNLISDDINMVDFIEEASILNPINDTIIVSDNLLESEVTNYISDIIDDIYNIDSNIETSIIDTIDNIPEKVYSELMTIIEDNINMTDFLSSEVSFNSKVKLNGEISKIGLITDISSVEPSLNFVLLLPSENKISPEIVTIASNLQKYIEGSSDIDSRYKLISSLLNTLIDTINVTDDSVKISAEKQTSVTDTLSGIPTFSGSIGIPIENFNSGSEIYDRMVIMGASYGGPMWLEDESGRLKHIMQVSGSPNSQHGPSGMSNTGHIETRCHAGYGGNFQTFGDVETVSSSFVPSVDDGYGRIVPRRTWGMRASTDYNDISYFNNRQNVDKMRNGHPTQKTYRSFVNRYKDGEGLQAGIPNGRTAFYATGSEGRGDLSYPENHYFFAPDYHMLHQLSYVGTQTTDVVDHAISVGNPSSGRTLIDPTGETTIKQDDDKKPWSSTRVPDENIIQLKNLRDK